MTMSGTYVAELPLIGSAENHYKRWKHEGHLFPDAIGEHIIHGVAMHDGDWDTHGAIRSWDYTCDGKKEVFKERREYDDEKMAVTQIAVGGHVRDLYKMYDVIFQFIPVSAQGCVCKITLTWEKLNEDSPEPMNYMEFVKNMVTSVDDHMVQGQNTA